MECTIDKRGHGRGIDLLANVPLEKSLTLPLPTLLSPGDISACATSNRARSTSLLTPLQTSTLLALARQHHTLKNEGDTFNDSTTLFPAFLIFLEAGVLSLESSSSNPLFSSPNSRIIIVNNVVHRR
jgi:hypothetical protein